MAVCDYIFQINVCCVPASNFSRICQSLILLKILSEKMCCTHEGRDTENLITVCRLIFIILSRVRMEGAEKV